MAAVLEGSALDRALDAYADEVDAVAASLTRRAAETASSMTADGAREHPTAFIETLTAAISVPPGCLFVGHTNTDMDSVGGAVGAAELYSGRACLAQPVDKLNGEIMYACAYARSGEKPAWDSGDIDSWKGAHASNVLRGFGSSTTAADGGGDDDDSLAFFGDVFDAATSKVVMVDHNAPSQMVGCLKKSIVDDGRTDILLGIIDHHALDEKIFTKSPLFMDVRPWGSMSTIVTHSFLRSAKVQWCLFLSVFRSSRILLTI